MRIFLMMIYPFRSIQEAIDQTNKDFDDAVASKEAGNAYMDSQLNYGSD